jgi:predicted metal-binding protein
MNREKITVAGRDYALSHSSVTVGVKELIDTYRDTEKFIAYCRACNRYNACWSCPPFDFDADRYLTAYQTARIFGTKIALDNEAVNQHQGWDKCTKISYEIIGGVRKILDETLLAMETQYPESKAFFAGSCRLCPKEECTRKSGKPCISPERVRPSLEALGFDVSRISAELLNIEMKWGREGILPEYFTLVSGFFSAGEINMARG